MSRHGSIPSALMLALTGAVVAAPAHGVQTTPLPVRFDANRILLAPVTVQGDTLPFLLDTGGGANMLYSATVRRLGLLPDTVGAGPERAVLVAPPAFSPDRTLPPFPPGPRGRAELLVVDPPPGLGEGHAGFLGRTWFADRVWTLDYPGRALLWHPQGLPTPPTGPAIPLGFQTDSTGGRTTHFPRMQAVIDGDTLDLLFDTGATVQLGDSAWRALGDGQPRIRGTSFISTSVLERWIAHHPDWRVVPNAERTMRFIEVPSIRIGEVTTGPVWFIERGDRNFTEYMSQWMDRPIVGALGGSAFRELVMVADYPAARLWVHRP
jgi:hypothetical protein